MDLLQLLTLSRGKKRAKKGKSNSAQISSGPDLRARGVLPPIAPPPPPAPAPALQPLAAEVMPQGPDQASQWLEMALSALGGGPDRSSYIRPFDEAEGRAKAAYETALPTIASQYDQLRSTLGSNQAAYQAQVGAARAAQEQSQAAIQQNLSGLQGRITQDVAANAPAGTTAAPAVAAAVDASQVGLKNQGLAQQQLGNNMATAQQQSHDSRIEDSRLAQQQAQSSAAQNLNSILNQIGIQRAGAERQYASDAAGHAKQVAGVRLEALDRQGAGTDPMKALQMQKLMQEIELGDKKLNEGQKQWGQTAMQLASQFPTSFQLFSQALEDHDGDPGAATAALAGLPTDDQGNYVYQGKRINVPTLVSWMRDFELQGGAESFAAKRKNAKK